MDAIPDALLSQAILPLLSHVDLASTAQACRRLRDLSSELWIHHVHDRWGPLQCRNGNAHKLLAWLETDVRRAVTQQGVNQALQWLADADELPAAVGLEPRWAATFHRLLLWMSLREKRCLASFACAPWQPLHVLRALFAGFPLTAPTPEAALRALLIRFPFLPIDAGQGADRVIAAFARRYVHDNGRQPAVFHDPEACDDATARPTVHVLVYSMIMLNTDLHNPAIWPKITAEEYVRSCRRCAELSPVPSATLLEIYRQLASDPLQIAPNVATVDTILRSEPVGETATPATYSIYSSLAPPEAGGVAGARPTPEVVVDWNVAYWNLVGMWIHFRATVERRVQGARSALWHSTAGVAPALQSRTAISGALILVALATWARVRTNDSLTSR